MHFSFGMPPELIRGGSGDLRGIFSGFPGLCALAVLYGPFCGLYAALKLRNLCCKLSIFVFF